MKNVDDPMSIKPTRPEMNPPSSASSRVAGASPAAGPSKTSETAAVSKDTVTFTSNVDAMLKLEETLASIPAVDNTRVAAIRASIAEGSYRIDTDKIVSSLLSIEKDLS